MKKIILLGFVLILITPAFAINNVNVDLDKPSTILTEIPQDVLTRFYNSFIVDERGNFLGAMVGEMKEYVSLPEILAIISGQGYAIDDKKIIDRHKPRLFSRGCKYKDDWICQFDDSLVD